MNTGPTVTLVAHTTAAIPSNGMPWDQWASDARTDADLLTEFAGRLCYQSWDKPRPATRANSDYLANILQRKHFSVLEHAGFTVVITGVSRSFTHELVHHRHLSFSQLSQRFVDESSARFVPPPLFRDDPEAVALLQAHHAAALELYRRLCDIADAEMREVALQIYRIARKLAPAIYQDLREETLPEGTRIVRPVEIVLAR
jgi:thymidylate synthase (FAD)